MGIKARNIGPGISEWAFIGVVIVGSLVCMGLIIYQKVKDYLKKKKMRDYVYGKGKAN